MFPVTHVDGARDAAVPPHEFRNHEDEAVYKMCESSGFLSPHPPVQLCCDLDHCNARTLRCGRGGADTG